MSFTAAQQAAINTGGNVLVVAGAGAGKTHTLVERCVSRILDPATPAGLEEILMVTFTEAAAVEMKQRIRERLGCEREKAREAAVRSRLEEQLALLDISRIGTLHGFCLQLIREHSHELALDPRMTVLAEEQSAVLMEESLDGIFRNHYSGATAFGAAVQELVAVQAHGREESVRELVLKLHHYTQTLPDPAGWFRSQLDQFRQPEPVTWRRWLMDGFHAWRTMWLPELKSQPDANEKARQLAACLSGAGASASRESISRVLEEITALDQDWPHGTKGKWRDPLEDFFADAQFLGSLARVGAEKDPLAEDWNWVRGQMETLLNLAVEFGDAFAAAKRAEGVIDFHDFEQFALRLLWDPATGRPRPLAEELRRRFKLVFVDEYQDINAAQDRIIASLSGEGAEANRFLVGDVKQSIYRFRLSDPRIFQSLRREWAPGSGRGTALSLAENFRSREKLLHFFNPVFAELMREEIGGVACGPEDELKFGAPELRALLSVKSSTDPCVEVRLRLKGGPEDPTENPADDEASGFADLAGKGDTEVEAAGVATRLRALVDAGHPVWDDGTKAFRPVRWGDVVVLLRSVKNKAEVYAKEFHRQRVPLEVERGGFYENTEITDLLSLLQLLDNPIQDVPLLAVLRSPLVGLSLNELATIRLAARDEPYWAALKRWHETEGSGSATPGGAGAKVGVFLDRHARWRRMARETSLSQRIEAVLDETNYCEWLRAQSRGGQRLANVHHLLVLARQFDPLQRQGLPRFLRFVEAQRDAQVDGEPPSVEAQNAVRLMSIHRSKGLEFPVVVLAGLGAPFNLRDLSNQLVLDEEFGLCPRVKPPQSGRHYPSLTWWLARQRQRREALGEELRLLYVAMTRARDTLLLSGTVSQKKAELWGKSAADRLTDRKILKARDCLDWLGPWLARSAGHPGWLDQPAGESDLFRWTIESGPAAPEPAKSAADEEAAGADGDAASPEIDPARLQSLRERIEWQYPFAAATREPAKTSVSRLRRRADETDEESRRIFPPDDAGPRWRVRPAAGKGGEPLSPAEIGSAHHLFLESVDLGQTESVNALRLAADLLHREGVLTATERAALDLDSIAAFWQSKWGGSIRDHRHRVHREIPFTARMSPGDLVGLGLPVQLDPGDDEFLVVQGVVDLAVILPGEIRLLDFKTDRVRSGGLDEKVRQYAPQLKLYGRALERIYRRPVTDLSLHFLALNRTVTL